MPLVERTWVIGSVAGDSVATAMAQLLVPRSIPRWVLMAGEWVVCRSWAWIDQEEISTSAGARTGHGRASVVPVTRGSFTERASQPGCTSFPL